jgi:AcrR family transcriptional regulator
VETRSGTRAAAQGAGDPEEGSAPARRRNARGEGSRLADEIVEGALAIIERTGSDEAVTLRSVAREVGIAAPSIYTHFADRDAIRWAVVERVFAELALCIEAGRDASGDDPVDQLVGGAEAYVDFGLEHPARYRVLFASEFPELPPDHVLAADEKIDILRAGRLPATSSTAPETETLPIVGAEAFSLVMEGIARCVDEGRSASTDTFADATAVWVALHGTVSLWSTVCDFPWPDQEGFVRRLVLSLARIGEATTADTKSQGAKSRGAQSRGAQSRGAKPRRRSSQVPPS